MARAVLGPLVQDLRGRLGNQVFDNYKGIHVVRSLPTVTTNPQSNAQTLVRTALAQFVIAWRGLTLNQKQLWEQVAVEQIRGKESDARMNRGGLISVPRGPFSGYNAFIALNMNRYLYGFSLLTDVLTAAPIGAQLPEPLMTFSAIAAGRTITASWTYINPGPQTARLGIWLKSTDAGVHPQLIYTEARDADGNTEITTARKTSGITIDLSNGVYQLQAIIVDNNGRTTAPSELVFVQIGAEDMFTYFAAKVNVLSLAGQVASIAETDIDMSAQIPAGAHSAIIQVRLVPTITAPAGAGFLALRKSAAQGDFFDVDFAVAGGGSDDHPDQIAPLDTARRIKYQYTQSGAGPTFNLDIFLLGYIS